LFYSFIANNTYEFLEGEFELFKVIDQLGGVIIWTVYMKKSKRVKNTFVND